MLLAPLALNAAELPEARRLYLEGDYAQCIRVAEKALRDRTQDEEWRLLLTDALLAVGRYTDAESVMREGLEAHPSSVRLRVSAYDVYRRNGQPERAHTMIEEVNNLASTRSAWAYQDPPNLVALGRAALLLGAEPRRVLERFFDRAKKADADYRDVYLAAGQLALDKDDYELAAKTFAEGLKRFSNDPDLQCGLASAYAPSDRKQMLLSIDAALRQNTNHVPSYLLLAAHLIDAEEYGSASNALAKALAVNPWQPEAWAYRAVIAHLHNDRTAEAEARATALKYWKTNPRVDHLIGQKLSQKYRFAEGSARQRQALQFDPKYLPAKNQLAQDLLRLGDEQEGWTLALDVQESDAYNVEAYNLSALHDSLAKFQTLTNQDFILRMSPHEASVYGADVLRLLQRAKTNLCPKYGMELTKPTIVEVFPNQKDFGVRTFGMPGNPGYLGVCFGSVITANSPASQVGHPANWQAVLYHEFCHVVTLSLTRNKMPRWLSEGISVYEERQANPTWGQTMNPRYREMVLGKDFTPVSDLSAAFLTPKSEHHLQFAYYESSLVVEFLVTRFGLESVQKILHDLGEGVEINQAIAAHSAPMDTIEKEFATFARERAEKLAPDLDLTKPSASEFSRNEPDWMAIRSDNFYVLTRHAKKLLAQKKWEEAKIPLEHLLKLYPGNTDSDNAYTLLAQAHRNLGETNEERAVLSRLAALDADDLDTYLRLMELGSAAQDWPVVAENAVRFLAVNPLLAAPHRYFARASETIGHTSDAIHAYQTLLLLDPPDPADAHFRLARLLYQTGDPAAKRHVLQALEEAPRFREAHRLLLRLMETNKPTASAAPAE